MMITEKLSAVVCAATMFATGAAVAAASSSITVADISSGRNAYSTNGRWTGGVAPAND